VKQHIAAKTDLNKKDSAGWTALHLAAMRGDLSIVKVLTEAGADVKIQGKDGQTPLDVAREKSQSEVVDYLQGQATAQPGGGGGRRLIDGGLGVSEAMDNM
jgi:ankyrin repeat protein